MRTIPALLLLGAFLWSSTAGQPASEIPVDPADPGVTVDQVLDRYLQAVGGHAAFEKLKSRRSKGTYSIPTRGYTTTVEVYAKAPNKRALIMTGKGNTAARGFDGTLGWSRNYAEEGLRVLKGAELAADAREADFYREIDLRKLYPSMSLKGKREIDGRSTNLIEAAADGGDSETFYFDAETGLLVKRDVPIYYSLRNVEVYLANYTEVDGVKLPFTVRIVRQTAPFMTIYAFDQVKHNVKIDDAAFEKPKDK